MNADFVNEMDVKQNGPDARRCPSNSDHGRLTTMAGGLNLGCMNRISEREAKQLHENGRPIAKLDGSKAFICAYQEPVGQ